jgi:hypothetical protein
MSLSLPLAIEALYRALLVYQASGDRVHVAEALRRFVTVGREAGVLLPALVGSWRTLWQHVFPAASSPAVGAEYVGDTRFENLVRVLLAEYDRSP